MNPLIYKIIHLAGVMGLFSALGTALAASCNASKKFAGIMHGISLLLIFVSGFGLIHKLGYGFAGWVIAKIVLFVFLGASLALVKRKVLSPSILYIIILIVGITTAYLGVMKPF